MTQKKRNQEKSRAGDGVIPWFTASKSCILSPFHRVSKDRGVGTDPLALAWAENQKAKTPSLQKFLLLIQTSRKQNHHQKPPKKRRHFSAGPGHVVPGRLLAAPAEAQVGRQAKHGSALLVGQTCQTSQDVWSLTEPPGL